MKIENMDEKDWIIMRLLYLMLAIDPSMATVDDVSKTLYLYEDVIPAFDKLKYEHGVNRTFIDKHLDTALLHEFTKTANVHFNYKDEEERDFTYRKVFGIYNTVIRQGSAVDDVLSNVNRGLSEHD